MEIIQSKYKEWPGRDFFLPVQGIIVHSMGQYINGQHAPDFIHSLGLSVHAFIEPNGNIILGAPITKEAYHAGKSKWMDKFGLNKITLGFELLVKGDFKGLEDFAKAIKEPDCYSNEQYESAIYLCNKWMSEINTIRKDWILGHSQVSGKDVRPDPKIDPGEGFDMMRLLMSVDGKSII